MENGMEKGDGKGDRQLLGFRKVACPHRSLSSYLVRKGWALRQVGMALKPCRGGNRLSEATASRRLRRGCIGASD